MIDDVFDTRISDALMPVPGQLSSAADILATIQVRRQRKPHGHVALAAVVVVVIAVVGGTSLALASAFGLFGTEPTDVHVTQPKGGFQPANGNRVGQPYTTSLQNAVALAGYPLLTLSAGTVQLVTVVPPTTNANGQPVSPTEVLKPSVQIDYIVNGTSVQLVEDPVIPGSAFQLSVKGYAASRVHQATVDGYHVIWEGADENSVDTVAFETTSGTKVYMTSGPAGSPGPDPGFGKQLSLSGYVALMQEMS
jgi:hypothetical protein